MWLKIKQKGLRKFWSMSPLTGASHFGIPFFLATARSRSLPPPGRRGWTSPWRPRGRRRSPRSLLPKQTRGSDAWDFSRGKNNWARHPCLFGLVDFFFGSTNLADFKGKPFKTRKETKKRAPLGNWAKKRLGARDVGARRQVTGSDMAPVVGTWKIHFQLEKKPLSVAMLVGGRVSAIKSVAKPPPGPSNYP